MRRFITLTLTALTLAAALAPTAYAKKKIEVRGQNAAAMVTHGKKRIVVNGKKRVVVNGKKRTTNMAAGKHRRPIRDGKKR